MCDLHLVLYMFLYVYVTYPDNAAVNSYLAPECSRQSGCSYVCGGASNRRHTYNRVRLLLVSQ
jgi:hypothetical protein